MVFFGLYASIFSVFLSLGAVLPVLPIHARDVLNAKDSIIGIIITATAIGAVVMRPIAGNLAEQHGYKFFMLISSLFVAVCGVFYLLPLEKITMIFLRICIGVGEGAVFTAGGIWTVAISPLEKRGKLIGLYGVSMWGGITFGITLGTILNNYMAASAVWLFTIIAPLAGAAIIALTPCQVKPSGKKQKILFPKETLLPGCSFALAAAGYAGLASFVVFHLEAKDILGGAAVLTAYTASYAGTRVFIGFLPDKYGPRRVAIWAGIVEAMGLLIIAFAPALWIAVIGGLVTGTGFSLLYPSLALIVINNTEEELRGTALGAFTSFWDVGLGLWGPVTGLIAARFGYQYVFITTACFACCAALIAMVYSTSRPRAQVERKIKRLSLWRCGKDG